MKVKRLSTTTILVGDIRSIEYELPVISFGKSLTDKSSFVPIADAVAGLTAGNRAHTEDGTNYDFPDGKDNGADISSRRPGRDIAEVFQDAVQGRQKLQNALEESARIESHKKAIKAAHVDSSTADTSSGGN